MRYVLKLLILCCLYVTTTNSISAQSDTTKNKAITFGFSYIGDVVHNFRGGIKTGTTYLGLINVLADFNTENANWWKGGEVFANIGNTHGGQPSTTLIGDFQGVSNIEAGNHSLLYELWYKHNTKNVDITIGLQDLNADFAASENGALFTNSSFGIQSSIADNVAVPIFPLTALGINLKWNISESYKFQVALFDGTPDDFKTNPYNINWKLSKNQGFLSVAEFQVNKSILNDKTASYKFGVYFHEHNDSIDVEQHNGGLYIIADQQISRKISLFSQFGLSPKSINNHNHYFSLGANFNGFSKTRPNDQFGIAFNYAGIDGNRIGSESVVELTYLMQLNKNIYLRPDFQYIINPAGTNIKLNNALVGFIRFGANF